MMRTIIAGSRSGITYDDVVAAIADCGWVPTVVLCGDCNGVDMFGARWARENNVPVEHYPADWRLHGKSAGPIRNMHMAHHAEALIAVWDGKSPGTRSMIRAAKNCKLHVYVWPVEPTDGMTLSHEAVEKLDELLSSPSKSAIAPADLPHEGECDG